ncbi:MAG TPA: prolipoprotein diacylglyceryl transferase [Acidimicrobiales bacterium]
MLASIPSPKSGALHIGPLQLRAYGLAIALGVWAACVVTARRYRNRGGNPELITTIAVWAVPAGIVGARLYSVVTSYKQDVGDNPLNILAVWHGGLGIWGGVLAGVVVGAWVAKRHGADVALLFDCVAPALPLAQAIGRWGNYFNQELFGKPTTLPWGLEIAPRNRPIQYAGFHTFQPVFLYESIWDLCVVGIVLLVERRLRLRKGTLLAVYVAAYTFGRFFTEYERIDTAHKIGPLRLNDWTSIVVFVAAVVVLVVTNRRRPDPGPALVAENGRGEPDSPPDAAPGRQSSIPPGRTVAGERPEAASSPPGVESG